MVKKAKNKSIFAKIKGFFSDVKEEKNKIIWTSKKNLIKFSIATLVFMMFICLYFVGIEAIIKGIVSLKEELVG